MIKQKIKREKKNFISSASDLSLKLDQEEKRLKMDLSTRIAYLNNEIDAGLLLGNYEYVADCFLERDDLLELLQSP